MRSNSFRLTVIASLINIFLVLPLLYLSLSERYEDSVTALLLTLMVGTFLQVLEIKIIVLTLLRLLLEKRANLPFEDPTLRQGS